MTRRELIWHAARTGGYGAAFLAMRSMDLLASPLAVTTPFQIPPNAGRGTKVAILGAGIAGLVAAFEMRKAGFDCTVLEAPTARRAQLDNSAGRKSRVHRRHRPAMSF